MTFTVFYDRKNFFGEWEYSVEEKTTIYSKEHMIDVFRKCMASFSKVRSFCFRMETDDRNGEMYIIEQSADDAQGGVYTVTHCEAWNIHNTPVKMSGRAVKKLAIEVWDKCLEVA